MTRPVVEDERFISPGADIASDYRRRRALEELERAELKRVDLETQCSPLNTADLRIRAWEKVHRLSIPSDPDHPVLVAIAAATRLTLVEVQNEQRLRIARRASAGPRAEAAAAAGV
jgi:hypothetical protein